MRQAPGCLADADLLLSSAEGRAHRLQFLLLLRIDRWVSEVEVLHRFHNGCSDEESGKPFVVSRHHVPWCAFRCRSSNRLLERVHIVAPELALMHIRGRELPMLVWPVEALHEALLLLLARHVQEELENDRPLPSEVILEVRNVEEPLAPDAFAHERRGQLLSLQDMLVNAHNEDLLVVRSVEDPDPSPLGQALDVTP